MHSRARRGNRTAVALTAPDWIAPYDFQAPITTFLILHANMARKKGSRVNRKDAARMWRGNRFFHGEGQRASRGGESELAFTKEQRITMVWSPVPDRSYSSGLYKRSTLFIWMFVTQGLAAHSTLTLLVSLRHLSKLSRAGLICATFLLRHDLRDVCVCV